MSDTSTPLVHDCYRNLSTGGACLICGRQVQTYGALAAVQAQPASAEPQEDMTAKCGCGHVRARHPLGGPCMAYAASPRQCDCERFTPPPCEDCNDSGFRVDGAGRDVYCHCPASPRAEAQQASARPDVELRRAIREIRTVHDAHTDVHGVCPECVRVFDSCEKALDMLARVPAPAVSEKPRCVTTDGQHEWGTGGNPNECAWCHCVRVPLGGFAYQRARAPQGEQP